MTPAALLGRVPLSNRLQVLPSVPTLVGEHRHKAIQAPVIEDRPIALAVLLLVGLGNHLPLGEIANHHGAFNQSVGDEMRGFVQTVTLFVALALRDALIDLREVEVPARFLLAAVPLRTNLVELAVVPVVSLEATDGVDAPLLVHARCQRLDAQVNGEQNEPEIIRRAFEQLYAECTADALCRERHPGLRGSVEGAIEAAEHKPIELTLQLEDGPQSVRLDGPKLLMVLLHMMREGEPALIPEALAATQRNDLRLLKMFAEDLESGDGGLLEQNAQQFDGLYNSIECRETWATVDRAARRKMIESSGVYGFNARTSKSPAFCPVWRVPAAPASERQPVQSAIPTLLLSGNFDWLTPPAWGREAARSLSASRHVVFRAQGHGVVVQDPCAARLRDAFIEEPDPKRALPCRADTPPNFTAAYERARNLP